MIESVELIIRQPGHPERVVRLREGSTRMGRAEDNDLILADVGVSRRHARLIITADSARVEDMGSGNGTYYRGRRVESQALRDGDEVIIDPFVLRLRIKEDAATPERTLDPPQEVAGARLDVMTGPALARSTYPIGPRGVTLGRSETRDVIIPDPASSRHHCSIFPQEDRYILRDMGSANGTYMNGSRIRETTLDDGDRVRIGNTEFRFVIGESTKVANDNDMQGWAGDMPSGHDPASSMPGPSTHATPPARRTTRYENPPNASVPILPMLMGAAIAVGALLFIVVILFFGGILLASGDGTNNAPRPLTWELQLPQDLPNENVQELFNTGTAAIRKRDNKAALEAFYRSLLERPGNPYGERLSLLAGEFVVLDALEPQLKAAVQAHEERDALRTKLLKESKWRSRRGYAAKKQIEQDFRDDPMVMKAWRWKPSELSVSFQSKLKEGDDAMEKHNALAASKAYSEALQMAKEPSWAAQAQPKYEAARRELAAATVARWREAVLADANGDTQLANELYHQILGTDPDNISAQLRIARIKKQRK